MLQSHTQYLNMKFNKTSVNYHFEADHNISEPLGRSMNKYFLLDSVVILPDDCEDDHEVTSDACHDDHRIENDEHVLKEFKI